MDEICFIQSDTSKKLTYWNCSTAATTRTERYNANHKIAAIDEWSSTVSCRVSRVKAIQKVRWMYGKGVNEKSWTMLPQSEGKSNST